MPRFLIGSEMAGIVTADPRKRFEYIDGKRTDYRMLDAAGRPASRIRLVGTSGMLPLAEVAVNLSDSMAEGLAVGDVIELTGQLEISITPANQFEVRQVVDGVTAVRTVGQFSELMKAVVSNAK